MYTRASIDALKRIIDLKDILMDIGGVSYSEITDNGHELRCFCPLHNGDQKTAFSWKKADGIWSCFTKKCGENGLVTRDVYGFVCLKKGISFLDAVKFLADKYNFQLETIATLDSTANGLLSNCAHRSKFKLGPIARLKELPGYSNTKKAYLQIEQYLANRKYTDSSIITEFNLYPCIDSSGKLRLGIPAYDENGELVGVNARRLDGIIEYGENDPKYKIIKGYKKSNILYNLHRAKLLASQEGLILVEGELSAIRVYSYGFKNVVCMSGNSLSTQQVALLYRYAYSVLFLIEEGQAAIEGVASSISKFIPGTMQVKFTKLLRGDPDDNSKDNITAAIHSAKELNLYKVNNVGAPT